ncbi:MAG TPA: hypothetical protein VFI48_12700 [Hyphomicrobiaceae bacterium]|nr:hypothetical protein [Hyphomicrobiaceae bacterium]
MTAQPLTRRALMKTTGAAAAATLAAPFVRTAGAAGSLRVGYWDHWVPGANTAMTQICEEWAEKEKVNLTIDYLSTQGQQALFDDRRRGIGEGRPRHHGCEPAGARRGCYGRGAGAQRTGEPGA